MTGFHDITPFLAGSNSEHGGFFWAPFGLLWLVVIGIVIWLVLRRTARRDRTGFDRARDILAERYASGELTRDEYRERLADLQTP
jgi:putative membrane protein